MSISLTNAEITNKITEFQEGHKNKYWNKYPHPDAVQSPIDKDDWGLTDRSEERRVGKECM